MRRTPLYLGLAASLMLGSAAIAQSPDAVGNKPMPQTQGAPPAATAPAPAQAQPAPSGRVGGSVTTGRDGANVGAGTTVRRDSGSVRGNVSVDRGTRFDRGSVTVGRGDRFDRGDRWRGDGWRYRHRIRPAFAFISGPRVFVRPGWCRGLHRGWHFAPGAGEHAGTHRGLFRC